MKYYIPETEKDLFVLSFVMIIVGIILVINGILFNDFIYSLPLISYGFLLIICFTYSLKVIICKKEIDYEKD